MKTRYIKPLVGLISALCLCLCLSACGEPAPLRPTDYTGDRLTRYEQTHVGLFDTSYTFVAYAKSQAAFDRLDKALYAELESYHRLFDAYHVYDSLSNLRTVNEASGGAPVAVEPELLDLLQFGRQMLEKTDGAVNIACGTLSGLWKEHREAAAQDADAATLPKPSEIEAARALMDMQALRLGTDGTVRIELRGMKLDVGAIAKGYAAQKAVAFLRAHGVTSAMLNLGGTVCTVGNKADSGEPWSIGVAHPDESDTSLMSLHLTDMAAATSGDYERYYEVDGVRYCHILDPETGTPARTVRAVTVIADDAGLADALSTALFVLPVEKGQELIQNIPGAEAVWMLPDGTTAESAGFAAYRQEGT